jgi:ATP-dependent RNA helicase SUPV3L1/SUV3
MSQEEMPKPSLPNDGPSALDAAPSAPAAPEAAPGAPEPMRAPPPLGPDQAVSGGEHVVQPAAAAAEASGDATQSAPAQPDQPHRRRRRRRRHRKGPPLNGASSGEGASVATAEAVTAEPVTGEAAASDGSSDDEGAGLGFSEGGRPILSLPEAAPPSPSLPGSPAQPGEHKRRRRRRRRGKRPEGAAPLQASGETGTGGGENGAADAANGTAPASEGGTGERPPHARSPRHRRRRDRRDGAGPRPNDGAPREGGNDGAPREGASRDDRPRHDRDRRDRGERGDREHRDRERGPRDGKKRFGKKGGFGQGRDDRRPKEQPKLYSFESIVDRGFEDVADPANEGATRRVDWQIVKRTVADQKSAKPVSSVYLVRREGVDTDFANLAAARQAVNKTIVHPEKLTRPKADYPTKK